MSRKKIVLAYIQNDNERKLSYRKRKLGLIKKAKELSILCDVLVCLIIFSPYDPEPVVWPSQSEAMAVLERFSQLSDVEKEKKMLDMASFVKQRIKKLKDQLNRLRKANMRRVVEGLIYPNIGLDAISDFDMIRDASDMKMVISETLRSVRSLKKLKMTGGENVSTNSNQDGAQSPNQA